MLDPDLVGRILSEVRRQTTVPITVKCRLGVDRIQICSKRHDF